MQNRLNTLSPSPLAFLSNVFCSFHSLYSSIPHPYWLSLLLTSLISPPLFLCIEVHYFETYLVLILSLIFSFSQLFSIACWLSFMGIFICCRTLNIPDYGIQSLHINIHIAEDINPGLQGGIGKSKDIGQQFCELADTSFIHNELSSYGINLLQQFSPVSVGIHFKHAPQCEMTLSIPLLFFS